MPTISDRHSADDLVVVYSAANPQQAHLLRVAFAARGIDAVVTNDFLHGVAGELPFGLNTAPRVAVRAQDALVARELALEFDRDLRDRQLRPVSQRHWFQYSIWAIVVLTACVALYLGVRRAMGPLPAPLQGILPAAAIWTFFTIAFWRAWRRRQRDRARNDEPDSTSDDDLPIADRAEH